MTQQTCILVGAPVESGASQPGALMGPAALRTAGLGAMLRDLGYRVDDKGDVAPRAANTAKHSNKAVKNLAQTVGWTQALSSAAQSAAKAGMPIFLGGDHSLTLGTLAGVAAQAATLQRPQFVLWLDAHPDCHTPDTTDSGNLHGTPLAYVTGLQGFGDFPLLASAIDPANVAMFGIRSVDPAEQAVLAVNGMAVYDMRAIDEHGIIDPLNAFLTKVKDNNGLLHVSLDVDFLDPAIAPAVGTTVPGGATFREAHLIMEILHDSGLVTSLDLVELNPFLDERGRTAQLLVDLTASLMGRKVLDRPTKGF